MSYSTILAITFVSMILFIIIRVLAGPIKVFFKILYSCIVGGIGIMVFNFFAKFIGLHIGLNLITILTVGLLGVPGFALLLLLQIVFKS